MPPALPSTEQELKDGSGDLPFFTRSFIADFAALQPFGNPPGKHSQIEHSSWEAAFAVVIDWLNVQAIKAQQKPYLNICEISISIPF